MMNAWIETPDGNRIAIESDCYLGRSQSNTVCLHSRLASRRHAHIHCQNSDDGKEYWLADLGSGNGTLRNGKRITIPCRLRSGDTIGILDETFVFRAENPMVTVQSLTADPATIKLRTTKQSWLLMVDIKNFTALSNTLDTDSLSLKVGTWIRQCRDAIESHGGVVDKFLGDALFAYWNQGPEAPMRISQVIELLAALQQARDPDFRIVINCGPVTLEGSEGGADNVTGPEVIRTFRMEKVCSRLGLDSIVSETARAELAGIVRCSPVGNHPLDGFTGVHAMNTILFA